MKIEVTHCEIVGELRTETTVRIDTAVSEPIGQEELVELVCALKDAVVHCTKLLPDHPDAPAVNVFVDGAKIAANTEINRQATLATVSLDRHSPL